MEYGAKSLVIGLDLGGTNSVFGVVDSKGEIIATTSIKTQAYPSVDQYIMESVKAIKQSPPYFILAKTSWKIA